MYKKNWHTCLHIHGEIDEWHKKKPMVWSYKTHNLTSWKSLMNEINMMTLRVGIIKRNHVGKLLFSKDYLWIKFLSIQKFSIFSILLRTTFTLISFDCLTLIVKRKRLLRYNIKNPSRNFCINEKEVTFNSIFMHKNHIYMCTK